MAVWIVLSGFASGCEQEQVLSVSRSFQEKMCDFVQDALFPPESGEPPPLSLSANVRERFFDYQELYCLSSTSQQAFGGCILPSSHPEWGWPNPDCLGNVDRYLRCLEELGEESLCSEGLPPPACQPQKDGAPPPPLIHECSGFSFAAPARGFQEYYYCGPVSYEFSCTSSEPSTCTFDCDCKSSRRAPISVTLQLLGPDFRETVWAGCEFPSKPISR